MHAFLCHETNFFCVSTTSGLLHNVFQYVSVHPIPIEICYGLLRYTKRVDDFFFCFFLAYLRLTGLLTTNEQWVSSKKGLPNIAMRTSGIRNVAMTFSFGFFWHVFGLTGRRQYDVLSVSALGPNSA